jgi:ABC-type multidrug transport system ATPase subunit
MDAVEITLQHIGKRFGRQWLFKDLSAQMEQGKSYALTGNNGSGKSTLLQIIFGYQTPTKGNLRVKNNQQEVSTADIFKLTSFVAPYIELPEELTLLEQLHFHDRFKTLQSSCTISQLIQEIGLAESINKKIKHFSSGMKQRVKLAQAFYSNSPILLFDEPTTNLDAKGMAWYQERIMQCKTNRLVVIASNQPDEYTFVDKVLTIV